MDKHVEVGTVPRLSTRTETTRQTFPHNNSDTGGASLLKLIAEPEVEAAACTEAKERAKNVAQAALASAVAWTFSLAENGSSFEEMYASLSPLRALVRRLLTAQAFAELVGPSLAKIAKRSTSNAVCTARVILEFSSPLRLDLSLGAGSSCFQDGAASSLLPLIVSELRSPKADAVSVRWRRAGNEMCGLPRAQ